MNDNIPNSARALAEKTKVQEEQVKWQRKTMQMLQQEARDKLNRELNRDERDIERDKRETERDKIAEQRYRKSVVREWVIIITSGVTLLITIIMALREIL